MVDALVFPVSGVMKLWHILLHDGIGLSESRAWLFTIFGLIITVRLSIFPFFWKQQKNSRMSYKLRPQLAALRKEYGLVTDPVKLKEQKQKRKQLYKENQYSASAGCVPALIQIPVFIGLYRLMLRVARPSDGIESTNHPPIGLLSSEEVASFLQVRVRDVPIASYVSMSEEQFALLHTTHQQVFHFVLPLVICASVFTTVNMVTASIRNYFTLDFNSRSAVKMQKFMLPFMFMAAIFPIYFGLLGPFPVAIAIYWFGNNLWTLTQSMTVMTIMHYRYPLSEEFIAHRDKGRENYRKKKAFFRQRKWGVRRRRLQCITAGKSKRAQLHKEIAMIKERGKAYDEAVAKAKAQAKQAAKALRSAKRAHKQALKRGEPLPPPPEPPQHSREESPANDAGEGTTQKPKRTVITLNLDEEHMAAPTASKRRQAPRTVPAMADITAPRHADSPQSPQPQHASASHHRTAASAKPAPLSPRPQPTSHVLRRKNTVGPKEQLMRHVKPHRGRHRMADVNKPRRPR
ncbi:Membrane protein insertase MisCB precursor [Corynebacterium ciconiae DSM 44920]|uniref:membrane protein insertase YidC n=1 Tax=Corynebacterium ciconiae TaxID=227319 RepID=UPI0003640EEB|nr:membrane protein insertase YidC [Corynebacterium ciconiae]WKD60188.1 Membrane protein insertase MisCB precursor [Corynebacterium ciconiae DSM 44920]